MKCSICNQAIVLVPSAEERARKDVTGKPASYYTGLFTAHAQCVIEKRNQKTLELMRRSKEN